MISVLERLKTSNIDFVEDPPGSGLSAMPFHGLTPDNDGRYLIGVP